MKSGDMVRFKTFVYLQNDWSWRLGLLVKYAPWEKVGTVLCEGELLRVRAENIQKAGKKDESRQFS